MAWLKINYYDHSEGMGAFGKIFATNKYAFGAGLAYSVIDVLMVSKPQGYIPTIARFIYNTGPLMGMASVFTLTTYAATNVRRKDDRLNYFLGGLAAGGIWGAWHRSTLVGAVMGVALGMAGVVKKMSKQEGWEFFPEQRTRRFGSLNCAEQDYTILKDPPRSWSTTKPKVEKN